jgi:dihydrofolate reductase
VVSSKGDTTTEDKETDMRDLVLTMGCSIDLMVSGGPEEDIGGGGREHPDFVERKLGWLSDAGVLGMGRGLYEEMSDFWQSAEGDYARWMNEKPKVVFSRTLERADWPTTSVADGDLADEVARLKAEPGGDILVFGGYTLAQALTRARLVDEFRLQIRPVALGSGEPMFRDLERGQRLDLVDCTPYPDGSIISIYRKPA